MELPLPASRLITMADARDWCFFNWVSAKNAVRRCITVMGRRIGSRGCNLEPEIGSSNKTIWGLFVSGIFAVLVAVSPTVLPYLTERHSEQTKAIDLRSKQYETLISARTNNCKAVLNYFGDETPNNIGDAEDQKLLLSDMREALKVCSLPGNIALSDEGRRSTLSKEIDAPSSSAEPVSGRQVSGTK